MMVNGVYWNDCIGKNDCWDDGILWMVAKSCSNRDAYWDSNKKKAGDNIKCWLLPKKHAKKRVLVEIHWVLVVNAKITEMRIANSINVCLYVSCKVQMILSRVFQNLMRSNQRS